MIRLRLTKTSALVSLTLLVVLFLIALSLGAPPSEFRAESLWSDHEDESYDLAFLELTERGNLFHRERLIELESYVKQQSNILMIVFIHGWRHNASEDDGNVQSLRRLLHNLANAEGIGNKRLLGVYIGWPGLSTASYLSGPTFWSRKAVAEEVGKGGVSEILLRLEKAAEFDKSNESRNIAIFVGHSLSGAIMLAALHEIMLDKVISAVPAAGCQAGDGRERCDHPCVKTDAFGHGVILLNPAIEANQVLQLKESVAERCYTPKQDKLLHVISTEADVTTHRLFPWGQSLRMVGWREETALSRSYHGQEIPLSEFELDRTAIGNFDRFWTGRLQDLGNDNWRYCAFAASDAYRCDTINSESPRNLIPTRPNEPLSFIYTDSNFMTSHNDVFNSKIAAYVSAITIESVQRRLPPGVSLSDVEGDYCRTTFEFGRFFESLYAEFKERF